MRRGFVCLIAQWSAIVIGCVASGQSGAPQEEPIRRWMSLVETARQQRQAGAYQEAYQTLQQASALSQAAPDALQMRARSYEYLGSLAALLGRPIEAEALLKTAIQLWEKTGEMGFVARSQAQADLISLYAETGRPAQAGRLARSLAAECDGRLDQNSAAANRVYRALATAAYLNQDLEQAETLARKAIQIQRLNPGMMLEERSQIHTELGLILWKQGRKEEARQELRTAVEILEKNQRVQVVEYATALGNLAMMVATDQNSTESLEMMRRAIEVVRSTIGTGHVFLAHLLSDYANLLKRARRGEESKAARREAETIYQRTLIQQPRRYSVDMADLTRQASRR
ncbi:tetratricopeptide repeat protein [uncultured Paludibaculum sp.]|uniref:tetratricopeptide repeat protein n=1 Tax=uncultured Paludibaculum sp. TaxID=1765020 RepID=UPI002AAB69B6|nr:tetratricopeptide repeat protein [uncultured Paludibaculum sp.]